MLLGLAIYLALRPKYLAGIGDAPNRAIAAAVAPVDAPLTRDERDRLTALLVLFAFTIVFWMAFEQAATSLNFFAQDRTDRMFGGFVSCRRPGFQSINPVVIVLAAPLFAALWTALARRGREPSTPTKMAAALAAGGDRVRVHGARGALRADRGALVSPLWLVAAYSFHTFGELCLSPIGLSFVTKLSPTKMVGACSWGSGSSPPRSPSSSPVSSPR